MEVVLQPSGCHWVVGAARRVALCGRVCLSVSFAAVAVSAPLGRGQGVLPLTPQNPKPIIPAL